MNSPSLCQLLRDTLIYVKTEGEPYSGLLDPDRINAALAATPESAYQEIAALRADREMLEFMIRQDFRTVPTATPAGTTSVTVLRLPPPWGTATARRTKPRTKYGSDSCNHAAR